MKARATAISVQSLVNRFGNQTIHDDLDLEILEGEIVGIVGGSGTGKSVLMRSIVGLHKQTAGHIKLMPEHPSERIVIGVLFQQGALFSALTVEQNVMVPLLEHTQLSFTTCQDLARLKIALVGLPANACCKYPAELSGGMINRAALARALVLDPPLLFLDEPTAGLDPIAAAEFDTLIQDLQRGLNLTVVIITHDLDTLFTICNRVAVLIDKKIIIDTLPQLMQSTHPWLQAYFHGPRARQLASFPLPIQTERE